MVRYALLLVTIGSAGCLGSALSDGNGADGSTTGGTPTGGNSSGGGDGDMGADATAAFYANVAPIIHAACSGCHNATGSSPDHFFSETPDLLTNTLAYPGLVGDSPQDSRMYVKGQHEGPALTPDELPIVSDWIVLYNSTKAPAAPGSDGGTAGPTIKPFAPSMTGMNTVDLSVLDPKLAGQTMTFTAKMVGTSIQLSAITVTAAPTLGVHVTHPLFATWDANLKPTPDPIDSFSGLDETVYMTQTAPLGPGTLVLPNFAAGSLISVAFSSIASQSGTAGTVSTACKNVAMFVANVKPLLASNTCSTTCHIGANPTAGLKWDTTPDAALCQVALTEINTATPAMSQLLLQPDPAQNNGHPKKVNPFTNFQTAVTNWINAEK